MTEAATPETKEEIIKPVAVIRLQADMLIINPHNINMSTETRTQVLEIPVFPDTVVRKLPSGLNNEIIRLFEGLLEMARTFEHSAIIKPEEKKLIV